jgi:hypothetical protein
MNFLEKLKETHLTILYKLFSAEEQTEREGQTLLIKFHNFRTSLKNVLHISRKSAKFLWHFYKHSYTGGPFTDTDNLSSESTNSDSNITLNFNHSESHGGIVTLHFLLRHYQFCPEFSF